MNDELIKEVLREHRKNSQYEISFDELKNSLESPEGERMFLFIGTMIGILQAMCPKYLDKTDQKELAHHLQKLYEFWFSLSEV